MTTNLIILIFIIIILMLMVFCSIEKLIFFSIFLIFFNIHVNVFGKDAITTGTAFIFVVFFKYLISCFKDRNFIKERLDYFVYALIFVGFLSVLIPIYSGEIESQLIGKAIKNYFGFLSSLLLFIIVKNPTANIMNSQKNTNVYIEKMLSVILILVSVHILISIAVKYFPVVGPLFTVFQPKEAELLQISESTVDVARIKSFTFTPESYGEILAFLSPIAIYKMFNFENHFWKFCLGLFLVGLVLSVTRSGLVLFSIGFLLALIFYFRRKNARAVVVASLSMTLVLTIMFLFPTLLEDVLIRFGQAADIYNRSGEFVEIINRENVFIPAWAAVTSNLTFLGNGVTEFHFHNLYLSVLHQRGFVGLALFLYVLIFPMFKLIETFYSNKKSNKELIYMCTLSMFLFLINEFKYEFIRYYSYQQICFAIFAIYYLSCKNTKYVYETNNIV